MKEIAKLKEEFPGLSAIFETNKVIEHSPVDPQGENDSTPREQVQQEVHDGNQG
jgi:hypothetical protein